MTVLCPAMEYNDNKVEKNNYNNLEYFEDDHVLLQNSNVVVVVVEQGEDGKYSHVTNVAKDVRSNSCTNNINSNTVGVVEVKTTQPCLPPPSADTSKVIPDIRTIKKQV
jgi:hypothetical protein